MKTTPARAHIAKWFFILISIAILYLSWKIIQPFVIVMITAAVFATVLSPIYEKIKRSIKWPRLSALVVLAGFTLCVLVPIGLVGALVTDQAIGLANSISENGVGFEVTESLQSIPFYDQLPLTFREQVDAFEVEAVALSLVKKVGAIGAGAAVNGVIAVGQFAFGLFLFYLALFMFMVQRKEIHSFLLKLSPFDDKLDNEIMDRLSSTVRRVMFGALLVALIQGTLAGLGMAITGVPGAFLWGAVTVVAAQVPMIGPSLVLGPAIIFLALTGNVVGAVFLLVWAVVAVGLVDNVVSPMLIGGNTKLPEVLILIFILGGLQLFGAIGFILGPTILVALVVLVEIYQAGFLEGKKVRKV